MPEQINREESILTGKMLSLLSVGLTTSLEKFSGWLLAGFGAAFALILSNIEQVAKFISIDDIKIGVLLYLVALATGVLQRWVGSGIMGGAMISKEAEELGRNADESVDFNNVLTEIERSCLYPKKWLVRYQFNKIRSGDFSVAGRMQVVMAQLQGYMVLIQGGLVISSIVVMVCGINA